MAQQVTPRHLSSIRQSLKSARETTLRPEHAERMDRFEKLTHFLDDAFQIPGTSLRIGWDTLIGLIPGLGDLITATLSGYLIYEARNLGVSRWVLTRMVGNVVMDSLIGAIPLVGDVFDAFFKSNRRNSRLLKKHLSKRKQDASF